jgi:hypothetical protein
MNGCLATASVMQQVNACDGLKDTERNKELEIFPNPTEGILILRSPVSGSAGVSWRLFNALGQLLDFDTRLAHEHRIDLSFYATGVYYLRVEGPETGSTIRIIRL